MSGESAASLAVDIVINNHNYDAFLADAIESACRQTHPRVRVIAVDDGSTDSSREILARHEREIEVVLKENGGQASAINAGMERCRGEVVIFLDADDVLHPEAASRFATAFAGDGSLSKAQARMDVIDAAGRPTGEVKPAPHMPLPNGDMRAAELAFPFDIPWMATSANAFKVEALRRILPVPEREYPVCGADWYLVHLSALLGRVASLEQVSASYRVHGANHYQPQEAEIDLPHLRETIGFSRVTARELLRLATELGLSPPDRILSIADLANRMISLKLEPDRHPVAGDRAGRLVADAVRAARRRGGVSAAMKGLFVVWFAAIAVAPRPLAHRLARTFLFPERRNSLNAVLARLHKAPGRTAGATS